MAPNQVWSLDFVADQLADGRRFRALTVVDIYTRESLAIEAGGNKTLVTVPSARGIVVASLTRGSRPVMWTTHTMRSKHKQTAAKHRARMAGVNGNAALSESFA